MIYFDADKIMLVLNNPHGRMEHYPHSKIIWRMLQGMYKRQTSFEREVDATIVKNEMGFNGIDGHFLSDIAHQSQRYRDLSYRQVEVVAKKLKKYLRQLVEIANEHQEMQAPLPKKNKKSKSKRKKADQKEMFDMSQYPD